MKVAKSSAHLGESLPMVGLFLVACLGIVLLVAFSSSNL